jgi:uncharacterized RDD family membrane protein YckC
MILRGTNMDIAVEPRLRAPAGRRFVAVILDCILISAAIALIGVSLAVATDGKVRVSNALVNATDCTIGGPEPLDLQLPTDFLVTNVMRCTRSFFGVPHDWWLTISEVAPPGSRTTSKRHWWSMTLGDMTGPWPASERSIRVPLDPAGHVTDAFYLNSLTLFVLAAYVLLLEWRFGFTLGKRVLGLRVRSLDGGSISFTQASKRVGMRIVPFLLDMGTAVHKMVVGPIVAFDRPLTDYIDLPYIGLGEVGLVLMIAFLINFIRATHRNALPWHDRWAGTEVICVAAETAHS